MRVLMVGLMTLALAGASNLSAASSQDKKVPGPPPTSAPSSPLPAVPPAPPSGTTEPAKQQPAEQGQWVHTEQYGWVWMPYSEAYTHLSDDGNPPSMYVYYPAISDWAWVGAPWLWGWGPEPYFGIYGTGYYGWYGYGLGRWCGYGAAYYNYGWSSCGYWGSNHWNGVQGGRPTGYPRGSQRALSSDHNRGGYGGAANPRTGTTGYRGNPGDRSLSGQWNGSRSVGSVARGSYGGARFNGSSGRGSYMGGGGGSSRGAAMSGGGGYSRGASMGGGGGSRGGSSMGGGGGRGGGGGGRR